MQKIALLTDSASDIPLELIKENNIKLLPFRVIYGENEEYADRIELTPKMMYDRLKNEIPKTSLPSMEKITNALDEAVREGYTHAIIFTISAAFSGTYNAARLISENYEGLKIYVFDTKTLTMAEGAMVLYASNMIKENKSFEEIIETLPSLRDKIDLYFTIDTLEYLQKGGRIGKVAGTVGEFLNIKPIITVADDGTYRTAAKARGSKKAVTKLIEIFKSYEGKGKFNVYVLDGDAMDKVKILMDGIKDMPHLNKCTFCGTIGPALGINTGPGLVGMALEKVE